MAQGVVATRSSGRSRWQQHDGTAALGQLVESFAGLRDDLISLFDLLVGLHRWGVRVLTYAAGMTDAYPPFRLDQGPTEPSEPPAMGEEVVEGGVPAL